MADQPSRPGLIARALYRLGYRDLAQQVERIEAYCDGETVTPPELRDDPEAAAEWASDTLAALLSGKALPDPKDYQAPPAAPHGDPQHDFRLDIGGVNLDTPDLARRMYRNE